MTTRSPAPAAVSVQEPPSARVYTSMRRLRWETPHQAKETYVVGLHAIRSGDVLTIGAAAYTVRGVAEWLPPRAGVLPVTHLVLEEVVG